MITVTVTTDQGQTSQVFDPAPADVVADVVTPAIKAHTDQVPGADLNTLRLTVVPAAGASTIQPESSVPAPPEAAPTS